MHTIKLKVSDTVYEKLIWLLGKFTKEEIEIIPESSDFSMAQEYLQKELNDILTGNAKFVEFEEAEKRLDQVLLKK